MKKSRLQSTQMPKTSYIVLVFSFLIAAFVLIPQVDSFEDSFVAMKNINVPLIIIAALCTFITYFAAAFTLKFIAVKKIKYAKTLLVQFASGFATKLTPAGVGGFALNTRYLTQQKHSVVQAGSVLALNGLLGFIGHMFIITFALIFAEETLRQTINFSFSPLVILIIGSVLLFLIASVTFIKVIRKWVVNILLQLKHLIILFINQPKRLLLGFIGALAVTIFYTLALFISAQALNVDLNFLESLLVFTAGAIGASVTPTPGGLGGAEAALTAALVAVGIEAELALSVALTYRLVTYWMPIIPGFITFQFALKKRYI